MTERMKILFVLVACLLILHMARDTSMGEQATQAGGVISDQKVTGFVHPESVVYDPGKNVLYVGQFGSVLKPTLKDGKGKISRVSLAGKVLEEQFLPAPGGVLNKPKGIWVAGNRLWVTDIDVVWIFDLKSRRGRNVALPGAKFANDPTVMGNVLFVSDSGGGQIYRVEPADFLDDNVHPKVSVFVKSLSFGPNGLFPARDGSLLVAGYGNRPHGIYSVDAGGGIRTLVKDLGLLDGIAQLEDGSLLVTDWKSKSLLRWDEKTGVKGLATGFQGPADFCVVPETTGWMVVVPDLVTSELRMIRLSR